MLDMHHINIKCQKNLFIDPAQILIMEHRELRCFPDLEFQRDFFLLGIDRQAQVFPVARCHKHIVFITQCHRQFFYVDLRAANVVKGSFLEIQVQQIENVLSAIMKLRIHVDIVTDLLIRILHTVQMVLLHLGRVAFV